MAQLKRQQLQYRRYSSGVRASTIAVRLATNATAAHDTIALSKVGPSLPGSVFSATSPFLCRRIGENHPCLDVSYWHNLLTHRHTDKVETHLLQVGAAF